MDDHLSSVDAEALHRVTERQIHLSGFVLDCHIGIHEFELGVTQKVRLDITLGLDVDIAQRDDDIDSVVDYDYLRTEIHALVAARRFNLQETLCETIAELALTPKGVRWTRIKSSKIDVYPDCEAVSYEITVEKAASLF